MPLVPAIALSAGLVLLFAAGLHDVAFRTVPNRLTGAIALCGLSLRAATGDLVVGVVAMLLVLALALLCWHRGWMGGGDVKLIAAAALLVPPRQVPVMLVSVAIAGGVLALPYLVARRRLHVNPHGRPASLFGRIVRAERWRLRRGGPLPYAIAIALGAGAAIAQGSGS